MSSTYQRRLNKALDELPARLKFKALITNQGHNLHSLIVGDARPNDTEELRKLADTYLDLTIDYNHRDHLELMLELFDTREKLRDEMKSSASFIRACLHFIGVIERLNKLDFDNPYIEKFCDDWRSLLNATLSSNSQVSSFIEDMNKDKDRLSDLIDGLDSAIEQKENYLGFRHPLSGGNQPNI